MLLIGGLILGIRKLLLRSIPIAVLSVILVSVVYFIYQYTYSKLDHKISLSSLWIFILVIIILISNALKNAKDICKKNADYESIQYRANTMYSTLVSLIFLLANLSLIVNILIQSFISNSFTDLPIKILFLVFLME